MAFSEGAPYIEADGTGPLATIADASRASAREQAIEELGDLVG